MILNESNKKYNCAKRITENAKLTLFAYLLIFHILQRE
jgi:hypothetical protein